MENRTKYLERKSKRYLEKYSRKIASYCYATAVLNSESSSYCMYFDEIEDYFNLEKQTIKNDKELQNKIIDELLNFEGVAEATEEDSTDRYFDIILYTDYMALDDSEDNDEEEETDCEHTFSVATKKEEEE